MDKVSFVIAAYNCEKYVIECVESCLNQSHQNIEVAITDDGSTDGTFQILEEKYGEDKRVKLFRFKENRKKIAAFNNSFKMSTGDFIAIVGADDINFKDRIKRQLELSKEYDLIMTNLQKVNENNTLVTARKFVKKENENNIQQIFDKLVFKPFGLPSIFMNRDIAQRVFPLPEDIIHEDYYIPLIASYYGKVLFVDEVLYSYRIHDKNSSGIDKDLSFSVELECGRATRDLNYYIRVREFLQKNKKKDYYRFIDLKIFLIRFVREKIVEKNIHDFSALNEMLQDIAINEAALMREKYKAMVCEISRMFIKFDLIEDLSEVLWILGKKFNLKEFFLTSRIIKFSPDFFKTRAGKIILRRLL